MIKEVVIPAAGLGTRFLPFTKSIPKEMLPILNKPAIEYIIKEGIASGINDFFIISNKNKKAINSYFTDNKSFKCKINDEQKLNLLSDLDNIINSSKFSYINQNKQLGLGHAILMAKDYIKYDYFAVILPDDLIFCSDDSAILQLINIAKKYEAVVIGVQEVPKELVSSYGIIEINKTIDSNLFEVSNLVEKPDLNNAPSSFAIVGRYILSNKIFDSIEKIKNDFKREIQLTDAIRHYLMQGNRVLAYNINGLRYDIGTPVGWLKANIDFSKLLGIYK